eukprot:GEMP01000180.1.p1 GENE.GEMP01000180.1~~GEMP01000180.1.p1  ORF type:complete len:2126 (+),score=462.29 GEMP01000180.1:31-6408(+)
MEGMTPRLRCEQVCDGFAGVWQLVASPCGEKVCVFHRDGFAVCSPQQGRELQQPQPMQVCCWTPCSAFLFLGDSRGTIYGWHVASHTNVWAMELTQAHHRGFLSMVAIHNGLLCLLETGELRVFDNVDFAAINKQFLGLESEEMPNWKKDMVTFGLPLPDVAGIVWDFDTETLFVLSDMAVLLYKPADSGSYSIEDSLPVMETPVLFTATGGLLVLVFSNEVQVYDAINLFLVGKWIAPWIIASASVVEASGRIFCLFAENGDLEVRCLPSGHLVYGGGAIDATINSGWFFSTDDALMAISCSSEKNDDYESDMEEGRMSASPRPRGELRRQLESLVEKSLSKKVTLHLSMIMPLAQQLLPHVPGCVGSQVLRAAFASLEETHDAMLSVMDMIQKMNHLPQSYDMMKGQMLITDALSRLATFQMLPGLHDISQDQDDEQLRASLSGRSEGARIPAVNLMAKQSLLAIKADESSRWNAAAWHYFRMANLPKLCVELVRMDRLQEMFIIFNRHGSKYSDDMIMAIIEAIPSISSEDESLIPLWIRDHVLPLLTSAQRLTGWIYDRTRRLEASRGVHVARVLISVICERPPPSIYFCASKVYNLWAGDTPWNDSELRTLHKNIEDIVWLERDHNFIIKLNDLETLTYSDLITRILDRIGAESHLEDVIYKHVEPVCERYQLDRDEILEDYIRNIVGKRQKKKKQHGSVERTLERGVEILKCLNCDVRKASCLVHLLQLKSDRYSTTIRQLVEESQHWPMPTHLRGKIRSEVTLIKAYEISINHGLCPPAPLDNFYVQRLAHHLLASINKKDSFQEALHLLEDSPLETMTSTEALLLRLNYLVRWSPTLPDLQEQVQDTLGTHVGEAANRFVEFCVFALAMEDGDKERMRRYCQGAIWTLQRAAHVERGWLRSDQLALMSRVNRLQEDLDIFIDPLKLTRAEGIVDMFHFYAQKSVVELVDKWDEKGSKRGAFGRLLCLADLLGLSQGHVWQVVVREVNTRKIIPQSLLCFAMQLVPKDFFIPLGTKEDIVSLARSVLRELSMQLVTTRDLRSLMFHIGRILDSMCYCLHYCHSNSIGPLVDFMADLYWSLSVLLQSDLGDSINWENLALLPIAHGHAFLSGGIASWVFPKKDIPALLPGRETLSSIFSFLSVKDGPQAELLALLQSTDCHFLSMRLATDETHYRELCSDALKTLFRGESRSDFMLAIALFGAVKDAAERGVALFQSTLRTIEMHQDPNQIYTITKLGRAMGSLWGDSFLTRRMQKMETSTKWSSKLGGLFISVTPKGAKLRHLLPEIVQHSRFDIDLLLEFAKDWDLNAEEVILVWAKIFLLTPKVGEDGFDIEYQLRIAPRLDQVDLGKTKELLEQAIDEVSPYDYERIRFIRRRLVGVEDKSTVSLLEGYARFSSPSPEELGEITGWQQTHNLGTDVANVMMDLATKRLPWHRLQTHPWDVISQELESGGSEAVPALMPIVTSLNLDPDLIHGKYLETHVGTTFAPGTCAFHLNAVVDSHLRTSMASKLMQRLLALPKPPLPIVLEVARFRQENLDQHSIQDDHDVVLLETRVDLVSEHLAHFEPLFLAIKQSKILIHALYYFLASTSYEPRKLHRLVDRIAARHDMCGKTMRLQLMKEWIQMGSAEVEEIFPTVSPAILHALEEHCRIDSVGQPKRSAGPLGPTRISEAFAESNKACQHMVHRVSYIASPKHSSTEAAGLPSSEREDIKSRLKTLLQWVFHTAHTLRHGAKVRCFQVCFSIAPSSAIQKVYNHPMEEIMEFWKSFVYMDRLEKLRLPQDTAKFLKLRKDGIIGSIWRTHKEIPEGVMVIGGLIVDFEVYDARFVATVMMQCAHLGLFNFLKVFLLELHESTASKSLPYDPELVAVLQHVLLELPMLHLANAENDDDGAAILIPIIPHILQRCPFVGVLSSHIIKCARELLAYLPPEDASPRTRRHVFGASPRSVGASDTYIALDVAFCSPKTTEVGFFLAEAYQQYSSLVVHGCLNAPDWFQRISFQYVIYHRLEKALRALTDPKGLRVFQEFVAYCAEKMQIERLLNGVLDNPDIDLFDAVRLLQVFTQVHNIPSLKHVYDNSIITPAANYIREILKDLGKHTDPRRVEFFDILAHSLYGYSAT